MVHRNKLRKSRSHGCGITSKLSVARRGFRKVNKKKNVKRILGIPKSGGFLPLIPAILAGLSTIGSLATGSAAIASAVNKSKAAQNQLSEQKRHNQLLESVALGNNASKQGRGLYLKPYKKKLSKN